MSLLGDLIAWHQAQRALLLRQIEMLAKGEMETHEKDSGPGWKDTSMASLKAARKSLAQIEIFLARYARERET